MRKAFYHIYVIQEHFNAGLGTSVQRWSLAGGSISRRIALHKARQRALVHDYTKIEVVKRAFNENNTPVSSMVVWQHKGAQNSLALRLKHKAGLFRFRRQAKH